VLLHLRSEVVAVRLMVHLRGGSFLIGKLTWRCSLDLGQIEGWFLTRVKSRLNSLLEWVHYFAEVL